MTTTVAGRLQQGAGCVAELANDAYEVLSDGMAGQIGTRMSEIGRRARRGLETASDARDEARMAIKRHPFVAIAIACGVGALVGVAVGRLASANGRDGAPAAAPQSDDVDIEC
jgi:ElaB/YqjD/DUF883 family membrane-anchored ribosome-binding protein